MGSVKQNKVITYVEVYWPPIELSILTAFFWGTERLWDVETLQLIEWYFLENNKECPDCLVYGLLDFKREGGGFDSHQRLWSVTLHPENGWIDSIRIQFEYTL